MKRRSGIIVVGGALVAVTLLLTLRPTGKAPVAMWYGLGVLHGITWGIMLVRR